MMKRVYDLVDTTRASARGDVVLETYSCREDAESDLDHYQERYNTTCEIVKRLEEDVLRVETSWCVDDVRWRLGDDVSHMADKEIMDGINDLAKGFHEMCVQSGWDVIDNCFTIKETK